MNINIHASWWAALLFFVLGWTACWRLSQYVLRYVLRNPHSTTKKAVEGMSQKNLVAFHQIAGDEIERRKAGR